MGPAVSTAFCGAIAGISHVVNLEAKTTIGAIGLIVALLLLILVPPLFTRWRPVDISSLHHKWTVGQLLRGARQLYGRHWRTILAIAAVGFAVIAAINGLQYLVKQLAGSGDIQVHPFGLTLEFNGSFGYVANPIGDALLSGAVVSSSGCARRARTRGSPPATERSWRGSGMWSEPSSWWTSS